MDFFSGLWKWFSGSSITSSLAKVAMVGYASKLLSSNTNPSVTNTTEPDKGVRLQLSPSTSNSIPILYGSAYFGGYITDAVMSSNYKSMTYCLTLCEITGTKLSSNQGTAYTFNNVYLGGNRVVFKSDGVTVDYTLDSSGNQDISYRNLIKIYLYGNQTGILPSGSSGVVPNPWTVMPGWTQSTHLMTNLIYAIVEVNYNKDKNVTSLPECLFHITSDMTLPGDVLYDYMTNSYYGANIPSSELDSSFIDLNTYCQTGFTYTDANLVSKTGIIGINGLVDVSQNVMGNMETLAKASGSWISYDIHLGKWIIVINKAGTSVASFNDTNIIGEISISGTSLTQLCNIANVKYQNTDVLDKTDFVKISIPSNQLLQNEPRNTIEISLPYTNKQSVAMKIGLMALKQARIDKVISFTADYGYMNLRAGELIDITNSICGYTNKMFRIISSTEVESSNGDLKYQFKCIEYDASVYTYSIQEYNIETDSGILSIGGIGKPNTPTVEKIEKSNTPRILINAVVPSGVVDSIEYWITTDTNILNDEARTYTLVGKSSNNDGSTLTENDTVSYTYGGLSQSNFYVKVRGVNNLTTGPFSDTSGLIEYVPVVVADTVSDTPTSNIGGQLMSLGLLTLLNNLDLLFGEDSSAGGVFDKIFKVFKTVTGVDLIQEAISGNIGNGGSGGTGSSTDFVGLLTFGSDKYPLDRATHESPEINTSGDRTKHTGDYYFTVSSPTYNPNAAPNNIVAGSGSIKLYKSDGTLVETVSASSLTIEQSYNNNKNIKKVSIPFATREIGVDYYILMDKNVVNDGTCALNEVKDPEFWNFHTADPQDAIPPAYVEPPQNPTCPPIRYVKIVSYLTSIYKLENKDKGTPLETGKEEISPDNKLVDLESNIGIQFNQPVELGNSGTITMTSGSTHQVFDISKSFINGKISELFWIGGDNSDILFLNPTKDFIKGTKYWVDFDAGVVKNKCNMSNDAHTGENSAFWITDPGPTSSVIPQNGKSFSKHGIDMNYDRKGSLNDNSTITVMDQNNNVLATVPGNSPSLSTKEG